MQYILAIYTYWVIKKHHYGAYHFPQNKIGHALYNIKNKVSVLVQFRLI